MTDAKWIAALREECALVAGEDAAADMPVSYSPGFEKRMDGLCRRMTTGKYRRVYGKARVMLIAAIVMVFLMTVTAGAVWYRATVRYDPDWGDNVFHVEGGRDDGLPANPRPAYIPDRFTKTVSETRTRDNYQLVMEAANGDILAVTVRPAATDHLFDAERGENDWIEVDGEQYFKHRTSTEVGQQRYATTLAWADDRHTIIAYENVADCCPTDAELASIIRSVLHGN